MDFVPAMIDLIAKTEIHGERGADLVIVLDKHLRTLQACAVLRSNPRAPLVCIAQQEICVLHAGSGDRSSHTGTSVNCPLLCVLSRELQRTRVGVAPSCGVVPVDQHFSAEVKDVLATNHGHYIGGIENVFLVNCVGTRIEPCVRIRAGEIDRREVVRLGKLPTQAGSITFAQREVGKEVALPCVAHSGFIDGSGADVPHIRNLRVVVVNIAGLASDRASGYLARVNDRSITLGVGHGQAVVR